MNNRVSTLAMGLRDELFKITLDFGPMFPIERLGVEESRPLPDASFDACYPGLKVLCHYTDASGLRGILDTGSLWATNVDYLNDPEEFRFAQRRLERMIRSNENTLDTSTADALLNGIRSIDLGNEIGRTFTISFSARSDDLSQFRAYSENGSGYCLEFEPICLIKAVNEFLRSAGREVFSLRKVLYGDEELERFHKRALEVLKNHIDQLPFLQGSREYLSAVMDLGKRFEGYLREAGVVFKQSGYRNEEEYRLVLDHHRFMRGLSPDLNENVSVRFRGALPVPYIPVEIMPSVSTEGYIKRRVHSAGLKRIIVGPGIDYRLAEHGLFYLMRANGVHTHVEVGSSKSSYRTW